MKAKTKRPNKIPQIFRLRHDLVKTLAATSAKTNVNKTRIVELALTEWLAVKR